MLWNISREIFRHFAWKMNRGISASIVKSKRIRRDIFGEFSDFNFHLFKIRRNIFLLVFFISLLLTQNFSHMNRFHYFDWFAPFSREQLSVGLSSTCSPRLFSREVNFYFWANRGNTGTIREKVESRFARKKSLKRWFHGSFFKRNGEIAHRNISLR